MISRCYYCFVSLVLLLACFSEYLARALTLRLQVSVLLASRESLSLFYFIFLFTCLLTRVGHLSPTTSTYYSTASLGIIENIHFQRFITSVARFFLCSISNSPYFLLISCLPKSTKSAAVCPTLPPRLGGLEHLPPWWLAVGHWREAKSGLVARGKG